MNKLFYHIQDPFRIATVFLLILSCIVTACFVPVQAEEKTENQAVLETEETKAETFGKANEQTNEQANEQAIVQIKEEIKNEAKTEDEKELDSEENGAPASYLNTPEVTAGAKASQEGTENKTESATNGEYPEESTPGVIPVGRNIGEDQGTAFVVSKDEIMPRSAIGSECVIRTGTAHNYGNWKTVEFEVHTDKGYYLGYCAQPNKPIPTGKNYQVAELNNEDVKLALMFGADGPWAEEAPALFGGVAELYPYIHAMIGVTYNNQTDGLTEQEEELVRNALDSKSEEGRKTWPKFQEYKAYVAYAEGQDIVWLEYEGPVTGTVQLRKNSSNPDMTDGNPCYSLGGAEYGIYSDASCATQVDQMTTKDSGESGLVELLEGDYWIKEITAPKGYRKDQQVYPVHVNVGENKMLEVSDIPENDPAGLELAKWDQEVGDTSLKDGLSLAGAQFTVRYYNGYYDRENLPQTPARTWVLETKEVPDASGTPSKYQALLREEYKVSGDAFYRMDGIPVLPLGTVSIEETKAPQGYLLENAYWKAKGSGEKITGPYITQICQEENGAALRGGNQYGIYNQVIRGSVKIRKRDLDTKSSLPQGSATLSNAVFVVVSLNKNAVIIDGKVYGRHDTIMTIETDENGIAQTPDRLLPYGEYRILETGAPTGYLDQGIWRQEFSITKDGETVDLTDAEHSIQNRVKRGDFELCKIDADTRKPMLDVPFNVTSTTTGESHRITTDENGYYSSSSEFNKHTENTNQGGSADGLWFGLDGEGGSAPVDNDLGALPYDTYILEEIPSKANEGKEMLKVPFVISEDQVTVDLGNLENKDLYTGTPSISTRARNEATGNHYAESGVVTIIDSVLYDGLKEDQEYLLKCTPMDRETEKPIADKNGNPITAELSFTTAAAAGIAELECTFDASGLAGKDIVLYEELYYKEEKVAEHKDIHDEGQTIHFPEITTSAMDKTSGTNMAVAGEEVTIVDTVFYKNLKSGQEYTLRGKLMDKETGIIAQDTAGGDVTAEVKFTPEEKDGEVEVRFQFDGSNLAGKTLVVFETLEENSKVYAVHADPDSEEQTVRFPKVETSAKNAATDSRNARPAEGTVIQDTVCYSNLIPGQEYKAEGILMDKETEQPLLTDGETITAETIFTPESESGSVDVTFEFDASEMEGKTAVAFETITREGKEVAAHKDIRYEGQTIYFPELKTSAGEKGSGSQKFEAENAVAILDKVVYQNLIPGEEYTLKGILMDRSTGNPFLIEEKEITVEKNFVPETADGTEEVEFILNASALRNAEIVVFEKLFIQESEITSHEDLADESQTVRINMAKTPSEDKPEDKPGEKTEDKPEDKPGEKTEDKPEDKPGEKAEDKPEEKSGQKTEEKSAPSAPEKAAKTGDSANIVPAVLLFFLALSILIVAARKKIG